MIKWFSVLKNNNIEFKLSEPAAEEEQKPVEEIKEEKVVEEAPSRNQKRLQPRK